MYHARYYHRKIPTLAAFHPYLHYPLYFRELPEANPSKLINSAKDTLSLLPDVETCLKNLLTLLTFPRIS